MACYPDWKSLISLFGIFLAFLIPDLLGSATSGCLRPSLGLGWGTWGLQQVVLPEAHGTQRPKQDCNPFSTGVLSCVNGEMRLSAFQILLVLFEELKPICLLLLILDLCLALDFPCSPWLKR